MTPRFANKGRSVFYSELGGSSFYLYLAFAVLLAVWYGLDSCARFAIKHPSDEYTVSPSPLGFPMTTMEFDIYATGYVKGARQNRKPPIYHITVDKETYPLVKAEVEEQISQMLGNAKKGSPRKWN